MFKVLLVEDEDVIRKGIRYSIPWEEYGCTVVGEARNGVEGKQLIDELNPDIVIADIEMPVMNGLEMIAATKFQSDYVAILLTGYSYFEYAREAIKIGVSDYVLKPLNQEEFLEALTRATLECRNIALLRQQSEDMAELKNLSLFSALTPEEPLDPLASVILEYIAEHYEQKISLSDISAEVHYSERYINQRFQKAVGTTVIEYLNRYRLQKALQLLKESSLPIAEIGVLCGVGDYKYFNYAFKKYVGCTPKEYRLRIS